MSRKFQAEAVGSAAERAMLQLVDARTDPGYLQGDLAAIDAVAMVAVRAHRGVHRRGNPSRAHLHRLHVEATRRCDQAEPPAFRLPIQDIVELG